MANSLCQRAAGAPENTAEVIAAHRGVFQCHLKPHKKWGGHHTFLSIGMSSVVVAWCDMRLHMSRRLCFGCGNCHEGIKGVTWGTTVPVGRTGSCGGQLPTKGWSVRTRQLVSKPPMS